jgi:RHH-type rel operon transcriptional repressor/antitoxin RelB
MAISLRLPADIESRLDRLAALTGRSKTYYAIEAIGRHLDDLEDLYVAEQRMREIRAGRSQTLSLEEITRLVNTPKA